MRHILNFSNYRTILTMTVTDYNYSPSFLQILKKKKILSRLTGYSDISKIVIFLGVKLSAILPPIFCLLRCPYASSSLSRGLHQSFTFENRCYTYFSSLATTLEPPEHWTEYVHLKALSTTSLQLSHNSLHFPPKGGSERSVMKTYRDISLLNKGFQVC